MTANAIRLASALWTGHRRAGRAPEGTGGRVGRPGDQAEPGTPGRTANRGDCPIELVPGTDEIQTRIGSPIYQPELAPTWTSLAKTWLPVDGTKAPRAPAQFLKP